MTQTLLARGVLAVVLLFPAASVSAGQKAPKAAAAGEEIIVTQSTSGQELRGRLVGLSSSSLALLVDGQRVEVPIDNVLRIDGRKDSLKNGTLIGLGIFGGLALLGCADISSAGWCAYAVGVNAGFGAAIGAGIDALHKGRSPIYVKTAGKAGTSLQVKFSF